MYHHALKHSLDSAAMLLPALIIVPSAYQLIPEIPNFAYLISAAYFFATGGGYDKLEVYKCSDGVKTPAVTREMVIRFPSCMVSWRHKEFHMVIQMLHLKSAPNLHPGALHFSWMSRQDREPPREHNRIPMYRMVTKASLLASVFLRNIENCPLFHCKLF